MTTIWGRQLLPPFYKWSFQEVVTLLLNILWFAQYPIQLQGEMRSNEPKCTSCSLNQRIEINVWVTTHKKFHEEEKSTEIKPEVWGFPGA